MSLCRRRSLPHWISSIQKHRDVTAQAGRQCRYLSVYTYLRSKQTPDFTSGFTRSYDPTAEAGRGPMFRKVNFGVPQLYPRDLKRRVDDYVVGQDRAKKTLCSAIFNHYQNLRRRRQHEQEDKEKHEKLMRQRFARERELSQRRWDSLPVEGELPLAVSRSLSVTQFIKRNIYHKVPQPVRCLSYACPRQIQRLPSSNQKNRECPSISKSTRATSS